MRTFLLLIIAAATGCTDAGLPAVHEPIPATVPAGPGASLPFAAPAGDAILVSWVEPAATGHVLRFARWDGTAFSAPVTVAEGADWFVNWADFPSIAMLPGGRLVAHWPQRSGPGRYAYDVLVTWSDDDGTTWSPPARPHRDGTQTEHGFVSLFPHGEELGIVWLDGRRFAAADGEAGHGGHEGHDAANEMMLLFTTLGADGSLGTEVVLDGRVCDCCQTAVAVTPSGPVVFFRDRSAEEVRDIGYIRIRDGVPAPPQRLHHDGWVIAGCPVNGPAAAAMGSDVAVAWFTAAGEEPRVNVAFSRDAGESFGPAIRVDDGSPVGRVDIVMDGPERALVVWIENTADGADVRARRVDAGGTVGPARNVAATSAQRATGFPRMARRGNDVLLLWTEPGEPSRIAAAVLAGEGSNQNWKR
jgi:hypothetical protein